MIVTGCVRIILFVILFSAAFVGTLGHGVNQLLIKELTEGCSLELNDSVSM